MTNYNYTKRSVFDPSDAGLVFLCGFGFTLILMMVNYNALTAGNFGSTVLSLILSPLAFSVAIFGICKNGKISLTKAINFKKKTNYKVYIVLIVLAILMTFLFNDIVLVFEYLVRAVGYKGEAVKIELNSAWQVVIIYLIVAIVPAIVEEITFRGIILSGLRSRFSIVGCVLLSSLCFTILHGSIYQTVFQFAMAVVFGFVYIFTNDIKLTMIMHSVNNITATTYSIIAGDTSLNSLKAITIIKAVLLCAICVGIIILSLKYVKKQCKITQDNNIINNHQNLIKQNPRQNLTWFYIAVGVVSANWIANLILGFI